MTEWCTGADAGEDVLSCGCSGGELLGSEMDGACIWSGAGAFTPGRSIL